MLELGVNLATLDNEKSKPDNPDAIKTAAKNLLDAVENDWQKKQIENRLNDDGWEERVKQNRLNKEKTDSKVMNYEKAKSAVAQFRGGLKNKIDKYKKITEVYKDVAMNMGRTFATIRDKVSGKAEANRVSHYAMIIKDTNGDQYALLQAFTPNENERIYKKKSLNGELNGYFVNSITSRAVAKMLSKMHKDKARRRAENGEEREEMTEEQKLEEWKDFVAKKQEWKKFNFSQNAKTLEEFKKEIDAKGFEMKACKISKETLKDFVENKNCLLLPIVNKDLAKEKKTEKNQFTKDWASAFDKTSAWRLTPEFRVSYRKSTPDYPTSKIGDKRYSRFQLTAHFLLDFIPQKNTFLSIREQVEIFNDTKKQKKCGKQI